MNKKIILDLCGGTGAWSKPYFENKEEYEVINVTLPYYDVRLYIPPKNVYGILAAPPCTMFAISGARWRLEEKRNGTYEAKIKEALSIVDACLRITYVNNPKFWCLENPVGILVNWLGKPKMYFNPCDYGDPYTKKTCLWGNFNVPKKNPIEPKIVRFQNGKRMSEWYIKTSSLSKEERTKIRSITPPGFAKAFYEANR